MFATFIDVLLDSTLDVLKMVPLMLVACFLADFIIAKRKTVKSVNNLGGVVTGSLLGIVPQCGISTGFAQLYVSGLVGLSVLMAVFISGSDEALIYAIGAGKFGLTVEIVITKIISGISVGAIIYMVERFRLKRGDTAHTDQPIGGETANITSCDISEIELEEMTETHPDEVTVSGYCGHGHNHEHDHHEHSSSTKDILIHSVKNTATITVYVFISVLIINLIVTLVGFDQVEAMLRATGPFQPAVAAIIGLIPSCAISIFITEAYISGFLTFGALIAGLCSNTGYGIVVLFKSLPLKRALALTGLLVGVSVVIGEILYLAQYLLG